jgi:hypothetical protein
MRPIYETAETLRKEAELMDYALSVWNWKGSKQKMARKFEIDWAIVGDDEEIVAWVETKVRDCRSNDFSTLMISTTKTMRLDYLEIMTGIPAYLLIGWKDKVGITGHPPEGYAALPVVYKGRTYDTRDPEDIEPCTLIPISYFREVK